jgi:hypothetical protein
LNVASSGKPSKHYFFRFYRRKIYLAMIALAITSETLHF